MTDLRKLARGRECQIRLPCCNFDPETTVLAHLNGGGMGTKRSDLAAAWACSECHRAVDEMTSVRDIGGRVLTVGELKRAHLIGVIRTIEILEREGYIRA